MARIAYDEEAAGAFAAGRHLDDSGLLRWREAAGTRTGPVVDALDLLVLE